MKAGFAVKDITPELGIFLTGYGMPERLAASVHSPLLVTAMVLAEGAVETAVIGLDWCFVSTDVADRIRTEVGESTGIPRANILLCCAHTHSAPQTATSRTKGRTDIDPEGKGVAYAFASIPAIADTVRRAREKACEAEYAVAAVRSETGVSRRGTDEHGAVRRFIGDPDQIYDPNLTAIHFRNRETGATVGIMIHLGCHNTSMGSGREISSDWCGVMRERIRDRYPVPVLYINGALGDIGPRSSGFIEEADLRGFAAGRCDGERTAREVGSRAAADALRALETAREFHPLRGLRVGVGEVRLPQAISRSEAEAREMLVRYAPGSTLKLADVYRQVAESALSAWSEPPQPEFVWEQSLIAFGPVALAPFPFEVFSVFSLRLRKYGPFPFTLLVSDANGYRGYLPDRGAIALGGYEVTWRERSNPYVLAPEAGDLAVSSALVRLRELAAAPAAE